MHGSTPGGFLVGLATTLILVCASTVALTSAALAARGGTPGPPPPPSASPTPVPPCISTAVLTAEVVLGPPTIVNNVQFTCRVRNVGIATHNVTIDIRDNVNFSLSINSASLPPGASFAGLTLPTFAASCVVTTDEATIDALNDLAVLIQANDPTTAATEGETEGRVYPHCAPAGPSAGN